MFSLIDEKTVDFIIDVLHSFFQFIDPFLRKLDETIPEKTPPTDIEKGSIRAQKISEIISTLSVLVRVIEKLGRIYGIESEL